MSKILTEIKKYVVSSGVKQKHLAEKAGISECALYSALAGKRRLTVEEFFNICDALNVSPNVFYASFCKNED